MTLIHIVVADGMLTKLGVQRMGLEEIADQKRTDHKQASLEA